MEHVLTPPSCNILSFPSGFFEQNQESFQEIETVGAPGRLSWLSTHSWFWRRSRSLGHDL